MKRGAEYSSSSSEDYVSSEEIELEKVEFSWNERNRYINTQLGIMEKLVSMSRNTKDPGFSKTLEIKAYNIYIQIESLLEAETMSSMSKTFPDSIMGDGIETISNYLGDEDSNVQEIGREASTLHLKVYGRRPRKMMRYFDGKPTAVNVYSRETLETLLD